MDKVNWKETLKLWFYTALKIPLIFYLRPLVLTLNEDRGVIKIKLNRRSKNHLQSMYFGSLCTGADLAPGIVVMHIIQKHNKKVNFLFKDFQADFFKRCHGDVHFTCSDGKKIVETIEEAIQTKERQNLPVTVIATVPTLAQDEPHAKFTLTLSIKIK